MEGAVIVKTSTGSDRIVNCFPENPPFLGLEQIPPPPPLHQLSGMMALTLPMCKTGLCGGLSASEAYSVMDPSDLKGLHHVLVSQELWTWTEPAASTSPRSALDMTREHLQSRQGLSSGSSGEPLLPSLPTHLWCKTNSPMLWALSLLAAAGKYLLAVH